MLVENVINSNPSQRQQQEAEQKQFVEEVGLLFETIGFPRMAGRVFGWLLISNPPYQSPSELADILQASKGSISTMTRLLEQIGLIERVSLPGQRRDYFRIKLNAWSEMSKRRLAQITAFRKLAERGLDLMKEATPELSERLREMHDIHAFFEAELPRMIERWQEHRTVQNPDSSQLGKISYSVPSLSSSSSP
ncbi:putative transcriptional regulator [Leptolyngbyaceae cyanobacterium JSC-12]|nr:putative transcriptional regulator [Leptolyngbyaceae cyanobacterium JSC-12]